jgi:hypothetical protein
VLEKHGVFKHTYGNRRAAVFYVDMVRGAHLFAQLS